MARKKKDTTDEERMVQDLHLVEHELQTLKAENADVFEQFSNLVERRNDIVAACRDLVKTRAEASFEPEELGPFVARPVVTDEWDLDAVEKVLSDEEFETAVRIDYKLRGGNASRTFLRTLERSTYPELAKYRKAVISRTNVEGPKAMDVRELEKE